MDCNINYLGGSNSSHTFVVDKKRYSFNGTNKSSMVVDVSVGKVLENIRGDKGRPLFFVDYDIDKVEVTSPILLEVKEPELLTDSKVNTVDEIKEELPEKDDLSSFLQESFSSFIIY